MIIDNEIILNPYVSDLDSLESAAIGDIIYANSHGAEFNLTEGKGYKLLAHDGDDSVLIENDLGNKEYYSIDYFNV